MSFHLGEHFSQGDLPLLQQFLLVLHQTCLFAWHVGSRFCALTGAWFIAGYNVAQRVA